MFLAINFFIPESKALGYKFKSILRNSIRFGAENQWSLNLRTGILKFLTAKIYQSSANFFSFFY
jgi:hypothetical protein